MPIADRLVSWYIKNILIPGQQTIDKPGYITKQIRSTQYNRDILIPESILADIETTIDDPTILYRTGKLFGYRLGSISDITQLNATGDRRFKQFAKFFIQYIASIYSAGITHQIDIDQKRFEMEAEHFVVCSTSGVGELFARGGVTGLWSYAVDDHRVEGVHPACEGRGDPYCRTICAPRSVLRNEGVEIEETPITVPEIAVSDDYDQLNSIQPTNYAETSLQDMLDRDFFTYTGGKMLHGSERYLIVEVSLPYLLEQQLSKTTKEDTLFDAAFRYGTELAHREQDREMTQFITAYLSACGWGDVFIKEHDDRFEVQTHLFPWTKFHEDATFPLYRGLVSGLLSGFSDRTVELTDVEKDLKGEGFTVIAAES